MKSLLIRSRAIGIDIFKYAAALRDANYEIKILLWDRSNNFENKENGIDLHTFKLKAPHDQFKVCIFLPIWWIYEFIFLLKDDSDIIHAYDLDTLIPAFFINIIKRKKLFYTIFDFYAHNLNNILPNFLVNIIASLERFMIGYVDCLFLVDESRYAQVQGAKIKKVYYIYNSPQDIVNQKNTDSKKNSNVIFYAGVLHETRGLKYVIEALDDIKNIKMIFAGDGPYKSKIKSYCDNKKNCEYLGVIKYEKVIEETMKADLLYAFYDPSIQNNKYASPNKLFEAMMCGKPIIVNKNIEVSKIVKNENCGLTADYADKKSIKEAFLTLIENPILREKLGKNGRNAYETKYSWEIMKKRLLKAYNYYETEPNKN